MEWAPLAVPGPLPARPPGRQRSRLCPARAGCPPARLQLCCLLSPQPQLQDWPLSPGPWGGDSEQRKWGWAESGRPERGPRFLLLGTTRRRQVLVTSLGLRPSSQTGIGPPSPSLQSRALGPARGSEGAWLWTTVPSGDGDGARRAASSTQLPPPLARTPGRASSKAEASSRGRGLVALTNGPGGGPGGAPSPQPAPRNSHLHSPLHALAPELYHANVRACGKAENTLRGTSAGSRLDRPAPATSCGAAEHRTKSCHLNLSEVHTSAALSTFTRLGCGHPFEFQNAVAALRKPRPPPPRPRIRHCLYLRLACPGHSLSADGDLPGLALFTRHRVPEVRPPRGASGPRSRLR